MFLDRGCRDVATCEQKPPCPGRRPFRRSFRQCRRPGPSPFEAACSASTLAREVSRRTLPRPGRLSRQPRRRSMSYPLHSLYSPEKFMWGKQSKQICQEKTAGPETGFFASARPGFSCIQLLACIIEHLLSKLPCPPEFLTSLRELRFSLGYRDWVCIAHSKPGFQPLKSILRVSLFVLQADATHALPAVRKNSPR